MTAIHNTALACVASALVVALPLVAGAQLSPRNQDTYFTFSQSVELPNATLPAGRYLFQLADSPGNRHIVRVFSADRQQLHTTLLAIPAYSRDEVPEEPEIRFMEGPAAGPNAIKIWFYPGDRTGHEFIYPRSRATQLAKATGESVLTTKSETEVTPTVADSDLTRVDPEGRDADVNMTGQRASTNARSQRGEMQDEAAPSTSPAPRAADQSAGATAQPAPASREPQATTDRRDEDRRTAGATGTSGDRQAAAAADRQRTPGATGTAGTTRGTRTALPRTASMLPLLGLIGVGSLLASRLVRRTRRA